MLKYIKWIVIVTIINLCSSIGFGYLIDKYKPSLFEDGFGDGTAKIEKETIKQLWFPAFVVFAATGEEVAFRFFPLALALFSCSFFFNKKLNGYVEMSNGKKMVMILFLYLYAIPISIVFGLVHGNYVNILFQGVNGLIWSTLVISVINNYHKRPESLYEDFIETSMKGLRIGVVLTSVSHTLFNLTIMYAWAYS